MEKFNRSSDPDIGDYLKLFACTAVMLQTVLAFALKQNVSKTSQIFIGIIYNLIKFTAPTFIFGILYTTTRQTISTGRYLPYLKDQWHSLVVPTIWWTMIYLLITPELQQVRHYHDLETFMWQFVNGNAAPHLWYNTMMLQFILLMPLFWLIGRWSATNVKRGLLVASITLIVYLAWISFYDQEVFHGPKMAHWYLLDRFFLSFLVYGIFGMLTWQYRQVINRFFRTWWPIGCLIFLGSFYWINNEFFQFGFPIRLTNAPYYKPSMVLYDLTVISLIAVLAISQLDHPSLINRGIHLLAVFAYKAFLSNAFWTELLWLAGGKQLMSHHLWLGIVTLYLGTWLLSFASAFAIHFVWQKLPLTILNLSGN